MTKSLEKRLLMMSRRWAIVRLGAVRHPDRLMCAKPLGGVVKR